MLRKCFRAGSMRLIEKTTRYLALHLLFDEMRHAVCIRTDCAHPILIDYFVFGVLFSCHEPRLDESWRWTYRNQQYKRLIHGSIDDDLYNERNGIEFRTVYWTLCLTACHAEQDSGRWEGPFISGELSWNAADSSTASTPVSFNRIRWPNILRNVMEWP
jgi:hypothetical protein